ncbi:NUDIX hydrolase [Paucisalibacillus globulus]|uniref:NUDIX hydrolase n=1 Tax=Paucisalibacillus globulus TaxID=351095 RepID=UPI0003FAA088|nr:NUDIX hydrolase [Paucisalibacillus globulus]
MKEWHGAAGICINGNNEVLMVKANNSNAWAIPSGGIEKGESPEECCMRELKEETGYTVRIMKQLFVKDTMVKGYHVNTYYFLVEKYGESSGIGDPDGLIEEYRWLSLGEIGKVEHAYLEDKEVLKKLLTSLL